MPTDRPARPATAGSRGPISRQPTLSPTGYRVSDRRRFELQMAALFTSQHSLQETIDSAVTEFLDRLRKDVPGFADALKAAERSQQHLAGVQSVSGAGSTRMRKP